MPVAKQAEYTDDQEKPKFPEALAKSGKDNQAISC